MLIIGEPYGQLGNRLSLWAHFLAAGREHGFRVMSLAFADYARFFRLETDDPVVVPSRGLRTGRLGIKLLRRFPIGPSGIRTLLPGVRLLDGSPTPFDLSLPEVHEPLRRGIHITRGWAFRHHDAVLRHAPFLRDFFRPAPHEEAAVEEWAQRWRQEGGTRVGVHLRRGDFRDFRGGGFLFDDVVYRDRMAEVVRRSTSQEVRFVLFSNEEVELEGFRREGFQVEQGPGRIVQDLYLMARCDLLLGPPSTFSSWASFYGEVPLGMIHPGESPDALDFRVVASA